MTPQRIKLRAARQAEQKREKPRPGTKHVPGLRELVFDDPRGDSFANRVTKRKRRKGIASESRKANRRRK